MPVVSELGPIITITLWASNSSILSVLAVGQFLLPGSSHVQKLAGGGRGVRGSLGFPLLRVFYYIYISPNSVELCS